MNEPTLPVLDLNLVLEALILVSDEPVSVESLAKAVEQEPAAIEEALREIESDYSIRGIRLQRLRDRVQFVSAPEAGLQVQKFLGLDIAPRLSPAALETLAIVAYRQPVTRPQVEAIRGVNCDGVIHNLLARGLIDEVGQLETVGHPFLYGTTFEFLQYFGLTTLDQLPLLPDDVVPSLTRAANDAAVIEMPVESEAGVVETPAMSEAVIEESPVLTETREDGNEGVSGELPE